MRDNKEQAIIYVPKKRSIEDISLERFETSVTFKRNAIKHRLKECTNLIFAHSHIIALSSIYDPKNPEYSNAMSKCGDTI